MRPAGFKIQAAVEIPTRRQIQLLAEIIAATAGWVPENKTVTATGSAAPAIFCRCQPENAMAKRGQNIGAWRNIEAEAGCVDVGAGEGAVNAGGSKFETAGAVQGIKTLGFIVERVLVAAGVVVFKRQSGQPRHINGIADIGMLIPGGMVEILAIGGSGRLHRTELADGFQLKVNRRLGGFDEKARAGGKIAAVTGWRAGAAALVNMIQIQLAVDAPAKIEELHESAGKPGVRVFPVENLIIVKKGG